MILGMSLKQINGKREESAEGEFRVTYSSTIEDVKETEVPAFSERVGEVSFTFDITYTQNEKEVGSINFAGSVLWKGKLKELIKKWRSDKKLPEEESLTILNQIYRRCLISATALSDQLGLPSPIPLPRVAKKK